jgi:hypothetical protein
MRAYQLPLALVIGPYLAASTSLAADWLTAPSYFTHDWTSGQRVAQHSPVGPFYYYNRQDFQKSGYRHYRSTLDLGNSSDNMHVVEQWGAAVVPYEAWRFPYRPYSAPYPAWGPPFGGLGGGSGGYPYSGAGANVFGGPFFPFWGGGPLGGAAPFDGGVPGGGALPGLPNVPAPAGPAAPLPGFPPPGSWPNFGGPGFFPAFPPPANFAQPWLDGHYPAYDLNDRSPYWQPYTRPGRP